MSDNKPLNDWARDFEALQRQYLGAWSDIMQKMPGATPPPPAFSPPFGPMPGLFGGAFGTPPAPSAGWQDGIEQWSRIVGAKGVAGDTVERMLDSSKSYLAMIKTMFGGAGAFGAGDGPAPAQAWGDAMRGGLGSMPQFGMPGIDATATHPFLKAFDDIAGKGAHGFGELPAAFAPYLEQFRQQNLSWLRMPAFGFAREHQEHFQRTALSFVAYQEASRVYNALLLKASQRGLQLMESKLAERSEPGRVIDSPRALYDLWVDAAEEAYAEIALSDEFGKAYGELANAQMRMRGNIQAEVERIGTDLGMPTRSELDSVHQRLHDLRRDFRDSQQGSAAISDLQAEVATLRAEVERLQPVSRAARSSVAKPLKTKPRSAQRRHANQDTSEPIKAKGVAAKGARPIGEVAPVVADGESAARARKPATAKKSDAIAGRASTQPARSKAGRGRPQRRARARSAPVRIDSAPPSTPSSFVDAIAAMRKRVGRSKKSARPKSVAAQFIGPSKSAVYKKSARKSKRHGGKS